MCDIFLILCSRCWKCAHIMNKTPHSYIVSASVHASVFMTSLYESKTAVGVLINTPLRQEINSVSSDEDQVCKAAE